ncbi:MAG: hypothetical protein LC753_04770 [Acidobacteria bacterium]|nr:hypothetical protein [Acidobacteriota bacterium]MCA1649612.1 hypothetical protein [Acidobacteriota bacterium]
MPYHFAGIDMHKKMLAVVVADVEGEGEYRFERRKVGTSPAELRALADWLVERAVDEVAMESTHSTGDPCGKRWSGIGRRSVGRSRPPARLPARSPRTTTVQSWSRRAQEGFS